MTVIMGDCWPMVPGDLGADLAYPGANLNSDLWADQADLVADLAGLGANMADLGADLGHA